MEEELLTVAEIAEYLKVNPQSVRNWIDNGDLPAFRVGSRRVRVSRRDFDAFLGRRAGDDGAAATVASLEVSADPWHGFAVAMTAATARLAAGEHRALTKALLELADAARTLADALGGAPSETDSADA